MTAWPGSRAVSGWIAKLCPRLLLVAAVLLLSGGTTCLPEVATCPKRHGPALCRLDQRRFHLPARRSWADGLDPRLCRCGGVPARCDGQPALRQVALAEPRPDPVGGDRGDGGADRACAGRLATCCCRAAPSSGSRSWASGSGRWRHCRSLSSHAPLSVVLGLLMGTACMAVALVERMLNPLLNIAQSLPHFAYMIPVVVFIGVGPKAGAIVTIIFSVPPMIRMTLLGLRAVSPEIIESGKMSGTTRWQLMTRVRLPAARTELLIGVNQVIMQSLAMVVLASFIGMPGLGQKLLQLLQALKIGLSVEIGDHDRAAGYCAGPGVEGMGTSAARTSRHGRAWMSRHRMLADLVGCVAGGGRTGAGRSLFRRGGTQAGAQPCRAHRCRRERVHRSDLSGDGLAALVPDHLGPDPAARQLSRPACRWPCSSALAAVGWRIGGRRSALVCLAFVLPIALSGWWDRAMITVYMVFVSVALAWP
jgi:glycine betaine/proline transport system permease protein